MTLCKLGRDGTGSLNLCVRQLCVMIVSISLIQRARQSFAREVVCIISASVPHTHCLCASRSLSSQRLKDTLEFLASPLPTLLFLATAHPVIPQVLHRVAQREIETLKLRTNEREEVSKT